MRVSLGRRPLNKPWRLKAAGAGRRLGGRGPTAQNTQREAKCRDRRMRRRRRPQGHCHRGRKGWAAPHRFTQQRLQRGRRLAGRLVVAGVQKVQQRTADTADRADRRTDGERLSPACCGRAPRAQQRAEGPARLKGAGPLTFGSVPGLQAPRRVAEKSTERHSEGGAERERRGAHLFLQLLRRRGGAAG